jgi:RNA polymerase-binding protein DksA
MRQFPNTRASARKVMDKKKTLSVAERKKLNQERAQTQTELARLREYLKTAPEPTGDEVDLDVYEREKNLALVRRLEQKLDEIDRALRSAQKGKYGICERCNKPIAPERLAALPETTLCVKCKNELEQAARRRTEYVAQGSGRRK